MKVVIVIPTFNERENTQKMITALSGIISQISSHTVEVLYVDGNSPDGTSEMIKSLQPNYPWLHLFVEQKKEGLGRAYAKGMTYAMQKLSADYLMEFDSDFQHPPADIPRLIAEIDRGYDYIIGSRYVPGGSIPAAWGFKRKFLSVVGNLVARIFLILPGIHDVTGGFKLSRVAGFMDQFDFDKLLSRSFAYKIHLLFFMVQRGAKVKEVAFHFANRTSGESKIIKNEMQESLRVIFKLQMQNPKMIKFFKFGVVGGTGFVINLVGLNVFNAWFKSASASVGVINFFANAAASELAIISNFIFNNIWTFKAEKITSVGMLVQKFLAFNISSVLSGILVPSLIIGLGTQYFGDATRNIFLVLAVFGFTVPFNWFIYNKFIWAAKK